MSAFVNVSRLCYFINGRTNCFIPIQIQICQYTKKSIEEKLGIEKPKRPLNPFFKFMTRIKPALLSKIPGISTKEAIVWSSKHWQQVDSETKSRMGKEYKKDLEDYQKLKALYNASLTDAQRADIKKANEQMIATREKRKLKAKLRELDKPRKPVSSYILYTRSKNDVFQSDNLKEYQEKVQKGWLNLPQSERDKFDKQAQDLMKKYQKDMEAWELKMISIGNSNLVRQKLPKKKKKVQIITSNKKV